MPKEQVSSQGAILRSGEASSPEDTRAIWLPPLALQIRSNFLLCSNGIVQVKHLLVLRVRLERRHPPRERVQHAIDNVEEHQVGGSHLASDEMFPVSFHVAFNRQGKVSQQPGNSVRPHVQRLAFRLVYLVFIVQPRPDGVVCIVRLAVQVQCGEHQLVDMGPAEGDLFWIGETLRSIQTKDRGEVVEDVRRLRYKGAVHFQDWGCKVRRMRSHCDFVEQIVRIFRVLSRGMNKSLV